MAKNMAAHTHMASWTQISANVFVSSTGDVHVCGIRCKEPSTRMAGVDVCPISNITMGIGAADEDDEAPPEEDMEALPQIRSMRYVDPMDVDGSLAVRNAAQAIFMSLFAKKICQPDAVIRRSLIARLPAGMDVEPALVKLKASLLSTQELDELTTLAFAFHTVIAEAERPHKVPFETVLCAVLHHSATQYGLILDGAVLIKPNPRVRAHLPIERTFETQAGIPVSTVKTGIGLVSRHIDSLVGLSPRPLLLNVGTPLGSRSRRVHI